MKKILLVAVALSLAFTVKAFAADTKQANVNTKPTTTVTTTATTTAKPITAPVAKTETKPTTTATTTTTTTKPATTATVTPTTTTTTTTTTATASSTLKGNITKLDNTNVYVKDNAGKEWSFKVGTTSVKEYKVGDNVEVKYEKDNLKSIAKATTK